MKYEDSIIFCKKSEDPNELAIKLCENQKKTLIFTSKTNYIPPIHKICENKNFIFFTENDLYFEMITEKFDLFEVFILVNKILNKFENEFFKQVQIKTLKKIYQIKFIDN